MVYSNHSFVNVSYSDRQFVWCVVDFYFLSCHNVFLQISRLYVTWVDLHNIKMCDLHELFYLYMTVNIQFYFTICNQTTIVHCLPQCVVFRTVTSLRMTYPGHCKEEKNLCPCWKLNPNAMVIQHVA
jgi:hypothetical protein